MRESCSTIISADAGTNQSAVLQTSFTFGISAQIITTGDAAGAVKLQFSNDPVSRPSAPTNFSDITSATASISAAGVVAIQKTDVCYNWVKVVYTRASGGGTITVNIKTNGA